MAARGGGGPLPEYLDQLVPEYLRREDLQLRAELSGNKGIFGLGVALWITAGGPTKVSVCGSYSRLTATR